MATAAGAGRDANKYEWQSWPPDSLEGMPPKRRRLAVWALFWLILLGSVVGYGLEGLGVAEPWRSLLVMWPSHPSEMKGMKKTTTQQCTTPPEPARSCRPGRALP